MIPKQALDLILREEGIDQPSKWPGGASGITIGYGYDLGYETRFTQDWSDILLLDQVERLKPAVGVRGRAAAVMAHRFDDITIPQAAAQTVFVERNLPREEDKTLLAFPGSEKLPQLAFGALVSLVFNRGAGMTDDPGKPEQHTRSEMRAIRDATMQLSHGTIDLHACLQTIAVQLRSMKRLWFGKGLDGLLARREHEAALIVEADQTLKAAA